MKLQKGSLFYRNKYFMRIMISISLVAVIMVGALTLALYWYGKQTLYRIQIQNNEQVLKQARFNIELMNSSMQNNAKYLFVNPDTTSILNDTGSLGSDEIYRRINRVTSSVITSNSFIHSIGFYNAYQNQYFYAGKQMYYDDEGMKRLIDSYPNLPRMKPIFRTLTNSFGSKVVPEAVITYIMYETSGEPAQIDAAIAINVNSDWLLENIKQISMLDNDKGEIAYIYSDSSGFLETGRTEDQLRNALLDEYRTKADGDQRESGSFEQQLNDHEYVISYIRLEEQGLTIFKVQSSDYVYRYMHALSLFLLLIFSVFVLLALFFSMKVSGIVYNPIRRLVSEAGGLIGKPSYQQDEIAFLSTVYSDSMNKLQKYDTQKSDYDSVVRDYFIKSILTSGVSRHWFEENCRDYRLGLKFDSDYYVYVIKLDRFAQLQEKYTVKDINLFKFAIMNIFEELIKESGSAVGVSFNEEDMVMLLESSEPEAESEDRIKEALFVIQESITQYYPISITVSISKRVQGAAQLPQEVRNAFNQSEYRFIWGRGSLITPRLIQRNKQNSERPYSSKWQEILLDNLRQGNIKGIAHTFDRIREDLSMQSYESVIAYTMHLMAAIHNELFSTGKIALREDGHGIMDIWKTFWNYETLEEVFESILTALDRMFQFSGQEASSGKNMVDAVTEIIAYKYTDNALCADLIADNLKMNARRLSKVFRDGKGMSIADYINEIRMKKAAELLNDSKMSVAEIISQVGYENESYFYRMFKSRYGMTPKEFAVRFNTKED